MTTDTPPVEEGAELVLSGGYDILGFNGEVELPIHAISSMCNKNLCVNILTSNKDCLLYCMQL